MGAPNYTFDRDRLQALAQFDILDTPPERGFDDIVELTAQICNVPIALVSLVADNRQWFKAKVGISDCETDLNSSVCAHALIEPDLLVVPDLTLDVRTLTILSFGAPPSSDFMPARRCERHRAMCLAACAQSIPNQGLAD